MKKRLFLIITFIITSVLVLSNTGTKEVNALENCEKHYNYYLFLDASPKSLLNQQLSSQNSIVRTTSKYFELGVPEDATNVQEGQIEIKQEGSLWEDGEWFSLYYFYLSYNAIGPDAIDVYNNSMYATAIEWYNENGDKETSSTAIPLEYDEFKESVPSDLATPSFSKITKDTDSFNTDITRTWTSSSISHIEATDIVWSPAVYYVSYDVCTEVENPDPTPEPEPTPEPDPTYNVDVEFVDVDTNERIIETTDSIVNEEESGTPYTYDCSIKKFDGYKLFSDDTKPSELAGLVTQNETLTCYYKKTEENHSLTVAFID